MIDNALAVFAAGCFFALSMTILSQIVYGAIGMFRKFLTGAE